MRSMLTPERTERIRQALLVGASIGTAAARGGIHRATYHEWETRGRTALEEANGEIEAVAESERRYADFHDTVTRAIHDFELGRLVQIAQAGRGKPYRRTSTRTWDQVVSVKGEDGKNTQQVVTMTDVRVEEGEEYDWRADAWLLERRNPQEYGRATRLELTGKDGGPIEVVSSLDKAIEDLMAQFPERADA